MLADAGRALDQGLKLQARSANAKAVSDFKPLLLDRSILESAQRVARERKADLLFPTQEQVAVLSPLRTGLPYRPSFHRSQASPRFRTRFPACRTLLQIDAPQPQCEPKGARGCRWQRKSKGEHERPTTRVTRNVQFLGVDRKWSCWPLTSDPKLIFHVAQHSANSDLSINPAQTFLYPLRNRVGSPIRHGSRVWRDSTCTRGDLARWL
jgi:hypothetical protein